MTDSPDTTAARPDHRWNDPDGDGHDCADCAADSMWKCDQLAHVDVRNLLTDEQRAKLDDSLRAHRATQNAARARAATMLADSPDTTAAACRECGHPRSDHPYGEPCRSCKCEFYRWPDTTAAATGEPRTEAGRALLLRLLERGSGDNAPFSIAIQRIEAEATRKAESPVSLRDEDVARLFHEAYERLAPSFGYETRKASAVPWADVPEPNRSLMIAVAGEVRAADSGAESPVSGGDAGTLAAALRDGAIPAMRFAATRLSTLGDASTASDLIRDADKIEALAATASPAEGLTEASSTSLSPPAPGGRCGCGWTRTGGMRWSRSGYDPPDAR